MIAGAAALAAAGLLSAPVALAAPYFPGIPDTPAYCGTDSMELQCGADTSPPTRAELNFAQELSTHFPGVPTAQWVQYARASCWVLATGASPGYVVKGLAQHLGTNMQKADQVMDAAMEADCPEIHIG